MGERYCKNRTYSKIDGLPEGVKKELDRRLVDKDWTYTALSAWLTDEGHEMTRQVIGRYAIKSNKAAQRIMEAEAEARQLLELVKSSEGKDIAEAGAQVAMASLTRRIALAEEEFDEIGIPEAIKLMTNVGRMKAYKDKTYSSMQGKFDRAFNEFKDMVYLELGEHKDIADKLAEIANSTLRDVLINES